MRFWGKLQSLYILGFLSCPMRKKTRAQPTPHFFLFSVGFTIKVEGGGVATQLLGYTYKQSIGVGTTCIIKMIEYKRTFDHCYFAFIGVSGKYEYTSCIIRSMFLHKCATITGESDIFRDMVILERGVFNKFSQ